MGVPKFFMYMSERYPCLSELAREHCIPDFDNLYLDMNGIVHNCTHSDDANFHSGLSEEDMFKDIFNYIDKLFFLIKPQKLFFMAIDGVAPRAKMNQQRSRRFRSAKEAEVLEAKAKQKGEVSETARFDSNCITPGTEFMQRLHDALKYFVKSKISTDPLWQRCRVILSGHDAPGEGEHKIMDYIRYMKTQPDFDPNTRHCLYGLDADLIILGLCTHELHFVVLREEVKFGRKTKHVSVEETRFFLHHLGLLREYLEMEFNALRLVDDSFNISNLIDDWVLMGFLVGNDFVPHLPCLHINSNALPLLYKTYIKVYPTLGGNINENGKLNLERLEKFFIALSEVEYDIFQDNYADLVYFDAKRSKNGVHEAFDFDVNEINNENTDNDLAELIENSRQMMEDAEDLSDDDGQHIYEEFETYKRDYYMNKLNKDSRSKDVQEEQARSYITALQWILDYYYRGVQSWDWYYPYHYSPFISDLKDFKDFKIQFSMGTPFLPFQQLLAVLPAASKQLLPSAYWDLMTSEHSDIIHFYPNNFETDLNGKKHEWESVVLIPFIDEKLLLRAMETCESKLTPSEIARNTHGPMLQYDYSSEDQGSTPGLYNLKTIYHVFCTEKKIWARDIMISSEKSVCVELPNAARNVFFPGFPTMKHLTYKFQLKYARTLVFNRPSRNESMVLMPQNRAGYDDILTVAGKYLNQVVYVGWPHLVKAKVVGVSNAEKFIDSDGIKDIEAKTHQFHMKTAQEHLTTRMGIEFDDFSVMVHVRTYTGYSYSFSSQGKVAVNDTWSPNTTAFPAQGVVGDIAVHQQAVELHKKVDKLFPVNSTVFFVGQPYYGSEGTVLDPMLIYECGRLKVNITVLPEPNFTEAKFLQSELERDYMNSYQASVVIGVNSRCLGRITGSILVIAGARRSHLVDNVPKTNIGLQLKYPKQQEERTGYARRINNVWFYSSKAVALIQDYCNKYPMVLDYLSKSSDRNEFFFEGELFPDKIGENCVEGIVAWLKDQDHNKAHRIACGSKTMEKEAVEKVLESIEQLKTLPVKTVKLQVKPHLLLKPDISLPISYKAKCPVRLFDRVIVVKTTYMVPLGSKGTVVGIYPVSDPNPVRLECVKAVDNFFEVLFDKTIPNCNDIYGIADERVYKVPESSVLLIYTQDSKQLDKQEQKMNDTSQQAISTDLRSSTTAQPPKPTSQQAAKDANWRSGSSSEQATQVSNWRSSSSSQQAKEPISHETPNVSNSRQSPSNWRSPASTKQPQTQSIVPNDGNLKSIIFQSTKLIASTQHQQQHTQQHQQQQQQQQQDQKPYSSQSVMKKGGDDFWMPAAKTIAKQANQPQYTNSPKLPTTNFNLNSPKQLQQNQQMPMPLVQRQQQQQPQQHTIMNSTMQPQERSQVETQVLKSLLGLSVQGGGGNSTNTPSGKSSASNNPNSNKRSNGALPMNTGPFKQLPQPPTCWRNDAQNVQVSKNQMPMMPHQPLQLQMHPPMPGVVAGTPLGFIDGKLMPIPFGFLPKMPLQMPQQQQPLQQQQQQQALMMPQAPQQLHSPNESSFSPESLHKKGAFIPLQAMRNATNSKNAVAGVSGQPNATRRDTAKPTFNTSPARRSPPPATDIASDSVPTTSANAPAPTTMKNDASMYQRKREKRAPKIGAKFDNMP